MIEGNADILMIIKSKLQSFTEYLRFEMAHYAKSLISIVQRIFVSIKKIFILAGRLDTKLSFYEVETLSKFPKVLFYFSMIKNQSY